MKPLLPIAPSPEYKAACAAAGRGAKLLANIINKASVVPRMVGGQLKRQAPRPRQRKRKR